VQKQSSSEIDCSAGDGDGNAGGSVSGRSQRQRLLDAMVACCAEKTFAGTTIADIVAAAGVSRTTFYKCFDDKRDCFDAAIGSCLGQLQAVAEAAHSAGEPPPEAVRKSILAVLDLMAARPTLAQLLSADAVSVDPALVERYRALLLPALEALWERAAGAPVRKHSSPGLAFGRAQLLIFHEIAAGRAARLPELRPEIVYLAVAPWAGHEEALAQARLAAAEDEPRQ
jgi:AcrR family transcriptional regulator